MQKLKTFARHLSNLRDPSNGVTAGRAYENHNLLASRRALLIAKTARFFMEHQNQTCGEEKYREIPLELTTFQHNRLCSVCDISHVQVLSCRQKVSQFARTPHRAVFAAVGSFSIQHINSMQFIRAIWKLAKVKQVKIVKTIQQAHFKSSQIRRTLASTPQYDTRRSFCTILSGMTRQHTFWTIFWTSPRKVVCSSRKVIERSRLHIFSSIDALRKTNTRH